MCYIDYVGFFLHIIIDIVDYISAISRCSPYCGCGRCMQARLAVQLYMPFYYTYCWQCLPCKLGLPSI